MRFKLKKGKFGCYFYDSEIKIDMTLEMVLNKLNGYQMRINKAHEKNAKLRTEIYMLKKDD